MTGIRIVQFGGIIRIGGTRFQSQGLLDYVGKAVWCRIFIASGTATLDVYTTRRTRGRVVKWNYILSARGV